MVLNTNTDIDALLLYKGIKRTGTTHLLLSQDQVSRVCTADGTKQWPNRKGALHPRDFISLSPIVFENQGQLTARLKDLSPRGRMGRGVDDSKANVNFRETSNGTARGMFEDMRCVNSIYAFLFQILARTELSCYRLFKAIVDDMVDKEKYNVQEDEWKDTTRIIAMTSNCWLLDQRPLQDRKRDPRVLDIGFAEASSSYGIKDGSTRHFRTQDGKMMMQAGYDKAVSVVLLQLVPETPAELEICSGICLRVNRGIGSSTSLKSPRLVRRT